jgi:hypothetical protein
MNFISIKDAWKQNRAGGPKRAKRPQGVEDERDSDDA